MERRELLALRACIPDRFEKEKAIIQRVMPFFDTGKRIGTYIPIQGEPDVFTPFQNQADLLVPKVLSKTEMVFAQADNLKASRYGILEPQSPLNIQVPQILFVPLVGFDGLHRMGHGAGYYDRYLARHPEIFKIGIAFDEQETSIQSQPWDVDMDVMITPTRTIWKTEAKENETNRKDEVTG